MKFIVQTNSKFPSITFIENSAPNFEMSQENFSLIKNISNKFDIELFIVEENLLYNDENKIQIIHDHNIDEEHSCDNIVLLIHDEKKMFDTFLKASEFTRWSIDLQINYNYDKAILQNELDKIIKVLKENTQLHVPQLNNWKSKIKFGMWGNNSFFISPEMDVYWHPDYYYSNDTTGLICKFEDLDFLNPDIFQKTKPHIICKCCSAFYCDRNIYHNKMLTSEWIVPSSEECAKTTIFNYFSKKLYNSLNEEKLEIEENLDKVFEFEPEEFYEKMRKFNEL